MIKDSVSYILKSRDTGLTWTTLWRGSKETMLMVSFADTLRGWMCSDSGVYKTNDGGTSWAPQTRSVDSQRPLVGIVACDTSTVYAIGRYGEFYSSSTGGNDWTINYGGPAGPITKLQFLSRNVGYAGGSSGLYKTSDGGLTWTEQNVNYTSVSREGSLTSANYSLFQNYPNPFNPSTIIRYALPQRAHVSLTVFNTLGQRIASLVNESQDPGYHDVRFDGNDLASGVYFYRLQAGTYVETKKLLLVR